MNILIFDYSSEWSTEARSFHGVFSLLNKNIVSCRLYDTNMSVYDNFDIFKPNVFITKFDKIHRDVIHYLSQNNSIKLIINMNGANEGAAEELSVILNNNNIDYTMFGRKNPTIVSAKYIKITDGADIFLRTKKPEYNINKLIFISDSEQRKDIDGTYHYTTIHPNVKNVDFIANIQDLQTIYSNYNEIVFADESYIGSQVFYNAILSGTKVTFDCQKDVTDQLTELFKGQKLLNAVKEKHTCINRLKTLFTSLSYEVIAKELGSLKI